MKSNLGKVGTLSASIALVAGGIGDVVKPLIPISSYVALGTSFLFIVCLAGIFFPSLGNLIKKTPFIKQYWEIPLLMFFLIATAVMIGCSFLSTKNKADGGVLASTFPQVRSFQESIGIVSKELDEISKNTKSIDNKISLVKKEVSSDPRKELANLGIPWEQEKFFEFVRLGDLHTIKLFVDGGMKYDNDTNLSLLDYLSDLNDMKEVERILRVLTDGERGINSKVFHRIQGDGESSTTFIGIFVKTAQFNLVKVALSLGADTSLLREEYGNDWVDLLEIVRNTVLFSNIRIKEIIDEQNGFNYGRLPSEKDFNSQNKNGTLNYSKFIEMLLLPYKSNFYTNVQGIMIHDDNYVCFKDTQRTYKMHSGLFSVTSLTNSLFPSHRTQALLNFKKKYVSYVDRYKKCPPKLPSWDKKICHIFDIEGNFADKYFAQ